MKTLLKRTKLKLAILLLFGLNSFAQEVYLSSGLNVTTYDFKGTDNSEVDFNSKTGQFYELGYAFKIMDKFNYGIGLAINNYGSSSGDSINYYEWKTSFAGINNHFDYVVRPFKKIPLLLSTGLQLQLMHIINGEQKINQEHFDLTNEAEFKGLWLQPGVSITAKYVANSMCELSLGYNYSIANNLSNNSEEKLKFINQQIRFGIHFIIN